MLHRDPSQQDVLLRQRLTGDVWRRSLFHRSRLERAGLGRFRLRTKADLRKLSPMSLADVPTPSSILLAEGAPSLDGPSPLAALRPTKPGAETPRYWPVQWLPAGRVPLAYSHEDLELLAHLGGEIYEMAGVNKRDVIVSMLESVTPRDRWQLQSGAHVLGASMIALPDSASVATVVTMSATVLLGPVEALIDFLERADGDLDALLRVHTVMVVGEVDEELFAALGTFLATRDIAVVRTWSPPGVLSLWGQCRGGVGFHTWPAYEIVELVDGLSGLPLSPYANPLKAETREVNPLASSGRVLWTGIGWYATALLRLATDAVMVEIGGPCPDCGRASHRVATADPPLTFADALDAHPSVGTWFAELHRVDGGDDQLMLSVALTNGMAPEDVTDFAEQAIGTTQVRFSTAAHVAELRMAANGERFSDRRDFSTEE